MSNADQGNLMDHPQASPDVGQSQESYWGRAVKWLKHENESKWLEDMRGMLSLVATMIATMTFQVAMNPPGGIFQADNKITLKELRACKKDVRRPCAGDAVAALLYQKDYHRFQIYNTVCFVASLSVSLLLISGIPLNRRFPIWILLISMIITLSFLALTFLAGILLVTPSFASTWEEFRRIYEYTIMAWIALIGIVGVFLTIRFLVWFVSKCIRVCK